MTDDSTPRTTGWAPPPAGNPFRSTAVGDPEEVDARVSIGSPPIRTALALLDEYLTDRPHQRFTPGNVVSVSGELGTGKTHLASRLVARCREAETGAATAAATGTARRVVRAVYLNLSTVSADRVYRRFVDSLPRDEVIACVRGYYTDLVAAMIGDRDLARRVELVLRDPELDPRAREGYIAQLGLSPTALAEQLRSALSGELGDPDYAVALSLLLRQGFEAAVWDWLRGGEPAEILRERGLSSPVSGDMAAITVFARLYARQGHRLVIIFDELESSLLTGVRTPAPSRFRRTLEQLGSAGTLVFLIGLPDVFEAPQLNLSRLIGSKIRMSRFELPGALEFVHATLGTGSLHPFSEEIVERIVELADGNPMKINNLCGRLYRAAQDQHTPVSDDMVREAALDYFAAVSRPRLASTVRRVLEEQYLEFRADHQLTVDPAGRVDFWLPVPGEQVAGGVIMITDAVSGDADVARLRRTADALDRQDVRFQALVVVAGGTIRSDHGDELRRAFGREPLAYLAPHFDEDLTAAVKAMQHAIGEQPGAGALAAVSSRFERLDHRQSRTEYLLHEMVSGLDALRAELHVRTGEPDGPPAGSGEPDRAVLDPFDRVLDELADLASLEATVGPLFVVDEPGPVADDSGLAPVRQIRNAPDETLAAVGCAQLLRSVVEQFRDAVGTWFAGMPVPARHPLRPEDVRWLDRLCARYDEVVANLPLEALLGLQRLPHSRFRTTGGPTEPLLLALQSRVESLAAEVRTSVLALYAG